MSRGHPIVGATPGTKTTTEASNALQAITVTARRVRAAKPVSSASKRRVSGEPLSTYPFPRPGETPLQLITADDPQTMHVDVGKPAIVRRGDWHRFRSRKGVTSLSVSPGGSEHARVDADDPRSVEVER